MQENTQEPTSTGHDLDCGVSRRTVLRAAAGGFGLFFVAQAGGLTFAAEAVGRPRMLDPRRIPKFASNLLVPPVMPQARTDMTWNGAPVDYYEIAVRQFRQQVLPAPLPATTVWGYGPATVADPTAPQVFNAPSLTVEAQAGRPVRVKWINDLVDAAGDYRRHLLPVDPSLHWANPAGGKAGRDTHPMPDSTPKPYRGPVPIVTHLHGAVDVGDESDGYAEAWYLPDAKDIPASYARNGRWYSFFRRKANRRFGVEWGRGYAVFQYPNQLRASTSWFHDHTLGMTRLNVYTGPAGFYVVRGGPFGDESVKDSRTGQTAVLPGPAPRAGDAPDTTYYEIPMAIQDRSFEEDGSLFYPDTREFFDGIAGPYVPKTDLPPIWNPEFFGNTMIVNGATWPTLSVEQRRYRFRVLNGCNSRFLILDFSAIPGATVSQVGNEGGYLAAPVDITGRHRGRLLLGPAERADIIVDFSKTPTGSHILRNLGPDEPFGGGEPGKDFPVADPRTTGQVMQFTVVPASAPDPTTPPEFLTLPAVRYLKGGKVRRVAILEEMSRDFDDAPIAGEFGTVDANGKWTQQEWRAPVTENPDPGSVETWEVYNATADAHPIHLHALHFEVVDRQPIHVDEMSRTVTLKGRARDPEEWERGWKDTVVAYPGEVTRLRMRFGRPGQYVWHCHILEHEDNEMMRPMRVGPEQPGQPKMPPVRPHSTGPAHSAM